MRLPVFWLAVLAGFVIFVLVRLIGPWNTAAGKPVTFLQLQSLGGENKPLDAGDLHGKVTLLNFWGTWCPPCRKELPHIVEIHEAFAADESFQLLAVSCGENDLDALQATTLAYLASQKLNMPTYADVDEATRRSLSSLLGDGFVYPTTLLLDRNAVIRRVWRGYAPGSELEMQTEIRRLLDEPAG